MRKRKAFTLIELLIVIAIIAVLAIIVVMNLSNARDKANYAKAKSDLKTVSDAVNMAVSAGKVTDSTFTTQGTATVPITLSSVSPSLVSTLKDEDNAFLLSVLPVPPTTSFAYWAGPVGSTTFTFHASTPYSGSAVADYLKFCTFKRGNVVSDTNCRPQ